MAVARVNKFAIVHIGIKKLVPRGYHRTLIFIKRTISRRILIFTRFTLSGVILIFITRSAFARTGIQGEYCQKHNAAKSKKTHVNS